MLYDLLNEEFSLVVCVKMDRHIEAKVKGCSTGAASGPDHHQLFCIHRSGRKIHGLEYILTTPAHS